MDGLKTNHRFIEGALDGNVGGVKYCVSDLIGMGIVKASNFKGSGYLFDYSNIISKQRLAEGIRVIRQSFKQKLGVYKALKAEVSIKMQDGETLKGSPHGDRRK